MSSVKELFLISLVEGGERLPVQYDTETSDIDSWCRINVKSATFGDHVFDKTLIESCMAKQQISLVSKDDKFWIEKKAKTEAEWFEEVAAGKAFPVPPDNVQISTVGRAGKPAFATGHQFYLFVRSMAEKYKLPSPRKQVVLDFGCGWGRILRFFCKDYNPKLLHGFDVQKSLIDIATAQVPRCNFRVIRPEPPQTFEPPFKFNIVYAYSVFSHLPEQLALAWLSDLNALLVRGGLLIITTRPREHIMSVFSKDHPDKTVHTEQYRKMFSDPEGALRRYDTGELVHFPNLKDGTLKAAQWGETMIPPDYAKTKIAALGFEFLEFVTSYGEGFMQPAIVLRKS